MSEDKLEEKYLGNAKLSQKPERKLVLRLGKDVVNTPNIKDGAVTAEKLNENVATDYIQPMLDDLKKDIEKQIVSIETGGLALSDLLGNSEFVGINQKTLTRYINDLQSQIELLESNVVIIQSWGDLASLTKGTHRYNPETDTLYVVKEVTTYSEPDENGIATPDTHLEWVVSPMDSKTLYLRRDTLEWYEYAGGKLIPIGAHRIDISELDTFINKSDLNNSSTGVYAVVDKEIGYDNVDVKIGTLSLFESLDEETITQIFTTQYVPVDGVFVSTSESSDIPKTYFRKGTDWECPDGISIINVQWTPWQEVSAHIDVDDALDPTYTSENPVKNSVISAKFDEVDAFLKSLQGADSDVEYFEDYDESDNVTFMNSTYTGQSSNGKIVYMTNYNVFAFKAGFSYYTSWDGTRGKISSDEYNMVDEETEELTIRKDKNFLLLTEDGGLPFTIDSTLNPKSANPVQNKVIYEALASLEPFVFTYYGDSIFEGNVIAFLDYSPKYNSLKSAFEGISEAFAKGVNVVFKPSDSNVHVNTVFTLTQFDIKDIYNNTTTNPCVGTVVGSDGFYSILINKNPGYLNNDDLESITFRRDVAFDRSLSMGDKSMLLMNSTSVNYQDWVANIDGSFLVYNYIDNKLYKLNQKNSSYIVESNRATPSKNIIYVDPAVNKCYRWNNDSTSTVSTMVSIGGGNEGNDPNNVKALQEKIEILENLLEVSSTGDGDNKVYSSNKLNTLTGNMTKLNSVIGSNIENEYYTDDNDEEQLTLTARLIDLENNTAGYLTEHQDLSNYATKNDLDTKADKGHSVIILSFYTDIEPSISDQSARNLNANMPNGIYWLDPYGTNNKFLHKGTYSEEYDQIIWNNREPSEEELLSEETLYVYKANKKMYLAKKTTNDNVDSWQIIEASSTSSIIPATIEVNTNTVSLDYASNLDGVQFKCKPFTVNPEECEVNITVNGEPYEENMLLSANNHTVTYYTVTYSIANPTKYVGNSVSYEVEVTQSQEIEQVFDFSVGNVGKLQILKEDPQNEGTFIPKKPEEITVNDVKAYNGIPELYSEYKITKNGQSVYPTYEDVLAGTISTDTPHLFTAEEIGLQYLDISSVSASAAGTNIVNVGKQNVTKIRQALENENCIGFKLTEIYFIYYPFWLKNGNGNNIQVSSGDSNVSPSYYSNPTYNKGNTIINISKDFIIDGEVEGEAVGGFESGNLQGAMFYTEHSLKLNKVHISCAKYYDNTVPCFYINCSNGINQLCVTDSIFDRNKSYPYTGDDTGAFIPSGEYIGLYFKDEDPIDNQGYAVANNYIEHVYICGCDFEGGSISDLARTHRVTKSFRIVSNNIHDVTKDGITFSTWNELTYENKMSYMSCPIYIIDNIISGMNSLKRDGNVNNYYTAILIESAVLYILRNEIKNFVCSSTNPDSAGACIYDSYFNGKQLYYANNIVSNIIRMNKKKINSGILKSKGVGYNVAGSPNSLIPPIRYYKDNKFLLNPSEITTMWNNRTPLGNQTYITTENNTDINELMSIMFESPVDIGFKDLTISGNLFNALWDGDTEDYESIDSSKTGNITGKNYNMKWTVANGYIEDNTFIATRMSSEEWGYTHDTGTSTGNTYLFGFAFNNLYNAENESTRLIVTGNDFTVYNNTPENIQFYDLVYNSGQIPLSEAKPQIDTFENNTINGSHCIKANYWNGATVRPSLWHKESNE